MWNRPRLRQFAWLLAAAALVAGAGAIQRPLAEEGAQYDLNPPEISQNYPAKTLLAVAPGGLRAPLLTYLWIRAEKLKKAGRHHEAMQLADLICNLQPDFEGVWAFQAWNMAWNISVTTHTPEERWLWVSNGMKLLRDRGIPLNPKALILYKELGWIFFNKMGQYMDDMNLVYKQRWAALMQDLLGAPPLGTTEETIAAFRPIAEAPLDKQPNRQAQQTIQADQLAIVLSEPAVAAYAAMLQEQGIDVDQPLLDAYNRYALDDAVAVTRLEPPALTSERDETLSALINDPAQAAAREKLLAFVRAQLLWNVYRLDPDWMLGLMERFGPLDWRQVQSHGLYWTSYGMHVCENVELTGLDSANTDRIVLNSLKAMTFNGRLTYIQTDDPDYPFITWDADWRFVEPCQQEYINIGRQIAEARERNFDQNLYRTGHINYLIQAIQMLYAGGRVQQAQKYYDWLNENYAPDDPDYKLGLEDFVITKLNREGWPIPDVARSQIRMSLQAAFVELAAGSQDRFRSSFNYAQRIHRIYQEQAFERNRLPDFAIMIRNTLANMLARPKVVGVNLSLIDRASLYGALDDRMQSMIYPLIAAELRRQCEREGLDFQKAFPLPAGMKSPTQAQTG